jgi:hypothetical protein
MSESFRDVAVSKALPDAVVSALVWSVTSTTFRVCWEKTSPSWT